jgi:hypothetical protein
VYDVLPIDDKDGFGYKLLRQHKIFWFQKNFKIFSEEFWDKLLLKLKTITSVTFRLVIRTNNSNANQCFLFGQNFIKRGDSLLHTDDNSHLKL